MNRSRSIRALGLPGAALILALVAVLAVVVGGALGRGNEPTSPQPTDRPSAAPTAGPTAKPTIAPVPSPSDAPADGGKIDLKNLTDHDVSVVIKDDTGSLVEAESGNPGDGMSVRWSTAEVENLDDSTLRLIWVGLPVDDVVDLSISSTDGAYRLHLVQAAPYPYTDAVGYDRILVLRFDGPVSAEDVQVTFEASPAG
jgi:hypothetical protein